MYDERFIDLYDHFVEGLNSDNGVGNAHLCHFLLSLMRYPRKGKFCTINIQLFLNNWFNVVNKNDFFLCVLSLKSIGASFWLYMQ